MVACGPDMNVALDTAGRKVLILVLLKRNDLCDVLVVCKLHYLELILAIEAVDDEVAAAKSRHQEVLVFAGDAHCSERLFFLILGVGLVGVGNAVEVAVPHIDGGVEGGGQELGLVNFDDGGNFVGVVATNGIFLLEAAKVVALGFLFFVLLVRGGGRC